jgi:very-short-patch-repair endonuclease
MTSRAERAALVHELTESQHGVASRRQLLSLGLTRWDICAELRAGRWRQHHRQTICVHTGPLPSTARLWHAVIEAGTRASLDGTGSLLAAGLTGFDVDVIRVSVPRGGKVLASPGADVRQTRRLRADDVVRVGIPRVRTPVAAVRAGLWARSDRQAALLLTMTVQQRLATAEQVANALLDVRRDRRRAFLEAVVLDLLGGVQSLGELDLAGACRRRGLPEPDRQVVRRGSNGRYYLDVLWSRYRLVVEVDGIHHTWATSILGDALRQNDLSLQGLTVLRVPLLGLRVSPEKFLDQIEDGLSAAGWRPQGAAKVPIGPPPPPDVITPIRTSAPR